MRVRAVCVYVCVCECTRARVKLQLLQQQQCWGVYNSLQTKLLLGGMAVTGARHAGQCNLLFVVFIQLCQTEQLLPNTHRTR
jgi:hypothetical protein